MLDKNRIVLIIVFVIFLSILSSIPTQINSVSEFDYRGEDINCNDCVINKTGINNPQQLINYHMSNYKVNEIGNIRVKSDDIDRKIRWNKDRIQVITNNTSYYSENNYEYLNRNDDLGIILNRIKPLDLNTFSNIDKYTSYVKSKDETQLTTAENKIIDIINRTDYTIYNSYSINHSDYLVYKSQNKDYKSKLIIKSDGEIRKIQYSNETEAFMYEFISQHNMKPPLKY